MTEHLTREELARFQFDDRVHAIFTLATRCRDRFVRAADLVCLRSPAIDKVRAFGYGEPVSVLPLVDAWRVVCERYLDVRYDAQLALCPGSSVEEPERWIRFVHWELFPKLVRDDELVRDVLRALGRLPCPSPASAAEAVRCHFINMHLPPDPPAWGIEDDIEP
jgi:hypothetical protein